MKYFAKESMKPLFILLIFSYLTSLFFTFRTGYIKGYNDGYDSRGYDFYKVKKAFK